ncbi:50S ribosomal protein L30 [Bdellovibrio sp. HCB2-146]|uniref:50S ribosomal protein L30 n=1 Tax=Bdellovibrio sp. HCB2-146 TaxID=3394362 RepID=UPI0039BC533A
MAKTFVLTLKRSTIGCTQDQKDAVRCLGLKKIRHSVEVKDSAAIRGNIMKIQHLVDVVVKG